VSAGRLRLARALRWAIALVALAFVVSVVPLRDRCWDPHAPQSTRVVVTRDPAGCVLHVRSGDVSIDADACGRLRCEPGLSSTLAGARVDVLVLLVGLYGLGTIAWAARWRALLVFAGVERSLWGVWRISIEAQAGGILLPGGIGGDALRVASVGGGPREAGQAKPPLTVVVASVLLDRAVGLAVVTAMAATLAFAWGGGPRAEPIAAGLVGIPVALLVAVTVLRRVRIPDGGRLLGGRLGQAVRSALEYLRHPGAPRAIAVAAAWSVAVAGVQFATIRGLVFALGGVPTAEKWVYLGTAMAFVVSALPALPGGWGTADAAYVFFLGLAGLGSGTALAVCLLYRLFWYLSGIVGAALFLARPAPLPAPPAAPPPA
jgi:uncharacterized membrane protein YbhN (UPF0104 family)